MNILESHSDHVGGNDESVPQELIRLKLEDQLAELPDLESPTVTDEERIRTITYVQDGEELTYTEKVDSYDDDYVYMVDTHVSDPGHHESIVGLQKSIPRKDIITIETPEVEEQHAEAA